MASKSKVRLDCRALPYLQPTGWPNPSVDPAGELIRMQTRSPVRAVVEAKSDLTFVGDLSRDLESLGLSKPDSRAATMQVLASPTVAARRSLGGGEELLQSVILDRRNGDAEIQVTVRLKIIPGKPGSARLIDVDADFVDLATTADQLEAVRAVELWRREFPRPNETFPEPFPIPDWAWVGDATQFPLLAPPDWHRLVSLLGEVYGVRALIADSPTRLQALRVDERVDLAFVLRGAKWATSFPSAQRRESIEVVVLSADHSFTFDAALDEARETLLTFATAGTSSKLEVRDLDPGEVVYHRKTGSSRRFDTFDQGSSSPCKHGAASFQPWGGDKATKGMARRYGNFIPDMLIHCNHFPNCGMYGLDASRGGLRPKDV